ncbi:DUF4331 family protein [Nocardioides sp. CN2-186]|uniref:DUF4331 family protein n=1 Tax=Nocardioides tweenelious TaxID=3156607 RepID=UPI0032B452D6
MSHHLELAPAHRNRRLDIADLYVFDAGATTVLVMNVRTLLADEDRDPFHLGARYEFKVHFDHREREDLTYRITFSPAENDQQPFVVERLLDADADDDEATGTVLARGLTNQDTDTQEGGQVWAGRAVDPFYLDLRQLDDIDALVRDGADLDRSRWVRGTAEDSFVGSRVQSIVLTVPVGSDGLTTGRQIGAWATTKVATDVRGWRQVGRSGLPLICEIFRPLDSEDAAPHQRSHPADDAVTYGPEVADLVASTVERLGTSDRPGAYADSVMERIIPDVLRYVVGSPAVFGFARFNGRALADNAPEVVFSLATNSAVTTGLRATDVRRSSDTFPFVLPA